MNNNRCVFCGAIIPEGRQVCPSCESGATQNVGNDSKQIKKISRVLTSVYSVTHERKGKRYKALKFPKKPQFKII